MNLQERLVRYADLVPCTTAFVDTRTPGSDRKENFTIIGPGVAENPDQHVHIGEPHGFNIGGARQPPGCLNSQHSHLTAEVFIVHSGTWAFYGGEHADQGRVVMRPGDVISIPTHAFRGFENVGEETGFLFAVLGGDDPGRVTWAPSVFDAAREHGLVLLENGALVDTVAGQEIPEGVAAMGPPTSADIARLTVLDDAALAGCVARSGAAPEAPGSLYAAPGCTERAVIGDAVSEGAEHAVPQAALPGGTGFQVREVTLSPGSTSTTIARAVPEVLFVHEGSVEFEIGSERFSLGTGDVFTVPLEASHRIVNPTTLTATVFSVLGTDRPTGRSLSQAA